MTTTEKEIEALSIPSEEPNAGEPAIVKNVQNADAALAFLRNEGDAREMTREDERRLIRKIDFMVVPLMWCCTNFVNRASSRCLILT